jgi:hypothetical protein
MLSICLKISYNARISVRRLPSEGGDHLLEFDVRCHVRIQLDSDPIWQSLHEWENPSELLCHVAHCATNNGGIMERRIEIFGFDTVVTSREGIFHDNI